MNPFRKRRIAHPDLPQLYYYTHGDVFYPGAENLAFDTLLLHPLQGIGGINVQRQIRVVQPPQLYQSIALPVQPLIAGVQAGGYYFAPLTDDIPGTGYN